MIHALSLRGTDTGGNSRHPDAAWDALKGAPDGDGDVDLTNLALLLANFGTTCP